MSIPCRLPPHARLHPYTPEQLLALVEGDEQFESRFGLKLAEGLQDFYKSDDVSPAWVEMVRTTVEANPWVHGFAVQLIESV